MMLEPFSSFGPTTSLNTGEFMLNRFAGATTSPIVLMLMHPTAEPHLPVNCNICHAYDEFLEAMAGLNGEAGVPINSPEDLEAELAKEPEDQEDK